MWPGKGARRRCPFVPGLRVFPALLNAQRGANAVLVVPPMLHRTGVRMQIVKGSARLRGFSRALELTASQRLASPHASARASPRSERRTRLRRSRTRATAGGGWVAATGRAKPSSPPPRQTRTAGGRAKLANDVRDRSPLSTRGIGARGRSARGRRGRARPRAHRQLRATTTTTRCARGDGIRSTQPRSPRTLPSRRAGARRRR